MKWIKLPSGGYLNLARLSRVYREHTGVLYVCYGGEELPESFTGEDVDYILRALDWQKYSFPHPVDPKPAPEGATP
jgi:hypothetical protein